MIKFNVKISQNSRLILVFRVFSEYFAMASEDLQKRLSLSIIRVALPGDVIWRPFLVLLVLFSLLPLLSGSGMRPSSFALSLTLSKHTHTPAYQICAELSPFAFHFTLSWKMFQSFQCTRAARAVCIGIVYKIVYHLTYFLLTFALFCIFSSALRII